jgi:uncharacterized protein with NRDE domain
VCLILFAWRAHPRYRLVLAANRDEFHQRPSQPADYWPQQPDWLAGRDLQAGGTWLGVTRSGRFAAVTNFREPLAPEQPLERSRGELVTDFLAGREAPLAHAQSLLHRGRSYRGFNLLLGSGESLAYVSNRDDHVVEVAAGSHGLSNHLLDTDWPKVRSGRERLGRLLQADRVEPSALLELLTERSRVPGEMPLDQGDGAIRRHLMNHYFILSPVYGTRSSTVLLMDNDGRIDFVERRFGPDGVETGTSCFTV